MTTLADMTKEDRDKCPGKWADTFSGYTGVILYLNNKQACLIIPEFNREETFPLNKVTPRDDLPRAWNPDGRPQKGEWQTAKKKLLANDNLEYDAENNLLIGDAVADPDHEPREDHDIRCWLSEWEDI